MSRYMHALTSDTNQLLDLFRYILLVIFHLQYSAAWAKAQVSVLISKRGIIVLSSGLLRSSTAVPASSSWVLSLIPDSISVFRFRFRDVTFPGASHPKDVDFTRSANLYRTQPQALYRRTNLMSLPDAVRRGVLLPSEGVSLPNL